MKYDNFCFLHSGLRMWEIIVLLRNGTIAEVYNNTTDTGIAVTGVPVSRAEVNRMMIRYQEGMSIPKEYA